MFRNMNMNENNKKISQMLLILSVAIPVISVLAFAPIVSVKATATGTTVTRIFSTINPDAESTFLVTLNITGLEVGGIVETIPDGFKYVGTDYLSNRTSVSGNKVAFAIVNTTHINYTVKAMYGTGDFSGIWEDYLSENSGEVEGMTHVSVRGEMTQTPSIENVTTPPTLTSIPTPTPKISGFEVIFVSVALFTLYLIFQRRRMRGDKG